MKIKGPIILKGGVSWASQITEKLVEQNPNMRVKLPFQATGFKCSNPDLDYDEKTGTVSFRALSGAPAKELKGPKKVFTNPKPGTGKTTGTIEQKVETAIPEIDKFKTLPIKEAVAEVLVKKFKTMNDMLRFAKRDGFKQSLRDLPHIGFVTAGRIVKALEEM